MHLPKDEQPGSDSSRTSIVSTLEGCFSYEQINHHMNFRLKLCLNNSDVIYCTDCLWGSSVPFSVGTDDSIGLACLPHLT